VEEIILCINHLSNPFNEIMLRLAVGEIHGSKAAMGAATQLWASAVGGRHRGPAAAKGTMNTCWLVF
jgi:hypothetical protein